MPHEIPCQFCGAPLDRVFVDLGMSPLCESFVGENKLDAMEPFFPLRVLVCDACFLVQLREYVAPGDIFSEYAYFSSFSDSWLNHARRYVEQVAARFQLDASSHVVEVASNDGYLLQYFVERGIPVTGIEPAANVAKAAEAKGIRTEVRFMGRETAQALVAGGLRADLLIGNNVLAHVPDINDFVGGLSMVLAPEGVLTMEFPHIEKLMAGNQFDTIYHEHFSYLSFSFVQRLFARHGLTLFDVEELETHGGSLRVYACHTECARHAPQPAVAGLLQREADAGFNAPAIYASFAPKVEKVKHDLLDFLISAKRAGKRIAGYGAPGKGNTLLNYCGIRTDLIDYTVDRNPYKHGKYCPGTHIPIFPVEHIEETRPDYLLILPWNLKREIIAQMAYVGAWGAQFVVPIPEVAVMEAPKGALNQEGVQA